MYTDLNQTIILLFRLLSGIWTLSLISAFSVLVGVHKLHIAINPYLVEIINNYEGMPECLVSWFGYSLFSIPIRIFLKFKPTNRTCF